MMNTLINTIEANREVAYHNRLSGAASKLIEWFELNKAPITRDTLVLCEEVKPPAHDQLEIDRMALDGLMVVSTDYSQHIFRLKDGIKPNHSNQ